MLMENVFRSKEYWSIVEGGIPPLPENPTPDNIKAHDEANLKDLKAKNYLFQAIDRSILETILDKETSKGIRNSLKQKYQGSTKLKRAQLNSLRAEFELLRMKESERMNEYFAKMLAIVGKMKIHGDKIDQTTVVEKALRTLMPKFYYVVCAIELANDVTTLTIDEVQSTLLVHEQRMQEQKGEEQALKVKH